MSARKRAERKIYYTASRGDAQSLLRRKKAEDRRDGWGFTTLERECGILSALELAPENITVHTLALKKGSRILLEGLPIPSAEDVAAMLDYADPALREKGFAPYYLYRQKYMSGSFENVGWCISGAEGLYNIYIMEELHSILSLGAGGSTKMVDAKRNRIERVFHPKFPLEYIQRPEKLTGNLEAFRRFHQEMAR